MGEQSAQLDRQATSPARLDWVDAAKGLGIVLVVAGHVWTRGPVRDAIYAFHMPLFFLLSGYLVRPAPWGRLLRGQAKSLLIPFASFSLLLIGADLLIEGLRGVRPIFSGWGEGFATIVLHSERLRGPFTILWFVPCLLLTRIAWNMVARLWPDAFDWRWAAMVGALLVAGQWWQSGWPSPMGLAGVPAAFAMFWAGQVWRARGATQAGALPWVAGPALALIWLMPPLNLKGGDAGWPLVSLIVAALASIGMCLCLRRVPAPLVSGLGWLGRASLVIMYVHVAFIHYLTPYLPRWPLFAIALVGGVVVHLLAMASRPTRQMLLGRDE